MKKKYTILITSIGSTTGISVVKGLKKQNEFSILLVGTDINEYKLTAGSSWCDIFHKVPLAIEEDYIPVLLDICLKEKVDVLIPIHDSELVNLSDNTDPFKKIGVNVILSEHETVQLCNDKYETYKFLNYHRIPTPETRLADEIKQNEYLRFPAFVKPRKGLSSTDSFRVNSYQELTLAREKVKNLVVQEYLEGDEFTCDVIADFEGKVFSVVPRRRIEIKSGISYKGETCINEDLTNMSCKIVELLNLKGPSNIQYIISGNKIFCIEINPRFSGSLPLTIAAGVNGPHWIIKLINGENTPANLLPYNSLIMNRYWDEVNYET